MNNIPENSSASQYRGAAGDLTAIPPAFRVSVNRKYTGKLPTGSPEWGNHTRTFETITTDLAGLAAEIRAGHAFCCALSGSRKRENFESAQHFALDFDTGDERSDLEQLAADAFIRRYAALLYTSPSHTPEKPRARVVFIFDQAITDPDRYTRIAKGFLNKFQLADSQCSDPARLWFASPGCEVWELGNVLPLAVAGEYAQAFAPQEARREPAEISRQFTPSGDKWLTDALQRATIGTGDKTGFWLACELRDDGFNQSDILDICGEYARRVVQDPARPFTEKDANRWTRSALQKSPRNPAVGNGKTPMSNYPSQSQSIRGGGGESPLPLVGVEELPPMPEDPPDWGIYDEPPADLIDQDQAADTLTDSANGFLLAESYDHEGHARCLWALHPGEFAYSEHLGWLRYNGRFWEREGAELRVERAAVETLKLRRLAAVDAEREPLVKAARGNRTNVTGTRDQYRSMVIVRVDEFDRDPDLLNCRNGVLNLRTGELQPHRSEQKFTYCIPVDYDPEADYSAWLAFLQEATNGETDLIDFLQLAVGYSLTGHTWEEIMFYLFGPTRSGKGTFTETLLRMFGNKPLAVETDFQTFTAERTGDTQNFDLAPLKPCRFVAASESNKHQPLNPAKIKQLTGGNYVYCAFKHREHFGYRPQFKIWLSSNHPVNVDVDDNAAWARVRVIEFPNSHLGQEDKALKGRLSEPRALRGILRWAVEGAQSWYASGSAGLPIPEKIRKTTEAQRERQDFIQQFIDEQTTPNPDGWIHTGALWERYKTWCGENGVTPKLQNQFSQALEGKGYPLARKRDNGILKRVIMGLK